MGELIELLDSVCEANGELLWEVMRWDGETRREYGGHTEEELAASKQSALTGILAEEDHLLKGD